LCIARHASRGASGGVYFRVAAYGYCEVGPRTWK